MSDTFENSVGSNEAPTAGISLADGKAVAAAKPAGSEVYIDGLDDAHTDAVAAAADKSITPKQKKIITVLACLNIAVFVFIGIYLLSTNGGDEYSTIKETNSFDAAVQYYNAATVFSGELTVSLPADNDALGILYKYKALYAANNDVVGWIRIEDTSIDFPVVRSYDNSYYERKNFYGGYDRRGSIFMDFRNTVGKGSASLSKNTIVYGHHLTQDACIFADVEKYLDVEYYKAHPIITMDTIYDEYKWKIFGCFITTVDKDDDNGYVFYYWYPDISENNTVAFADDVKLRSWFVNPAVDIAATDKLLCLSTCTYLMNKGSDFVEARCVLVARLVRENESAEVDVSGAYNNTSKRLPQKWYDVFGGTNPYANGPFWQAY